MQMLTNYILRGQVLRNQRVLLVWYRGSLPQGTIHPFLLHDKFCVRSLKKGRFSTRPECNRSCQINLLGWNHVNWCKNNFVHLAARNHRWESLMYLIQYSKLNVNHQNFRRAFFLFLGTISSIVLTASFI